MKIIDKIRSYEQENKPYFSFEFFPPKTEAGLQNLYARLDRMARLEPVFVDITWGAGGSTQGASLEIASNIQKYFGLEVMIHLTCTNQSVDDLRRVLERIQQSGCQNILALRGDPPKGSNQWYKSENGFSYASELVELIRSEYGDYFSVGVAGYPEGHYESATKDECVKNLKLKVDAGADFIITQLFFDNSEYFDFLTRARDAGIGCPVIPGILPILTYQRFKRFTDFCGTRIPSEISEALEPIKANDAEVQKYGIDLGVKMCREIRERKSLGIHFYTLNLETSVREIITGLETADACSSRRELPWRTSKIAKRQGEDVRPIFWSNRPKSYLARTENWDDFPNGRWGDSRSPSYGDLNDYYLVRPRLGIDHNDEVLLQQWGEPKSFDDISQVFVNFCQNKIQKLPWCEVPVLAETAMISKDLTSLNQMGFWTINSQPQVNGARSTDPLVGWGGPGGYVYQKAYVEFFVSPDGLKRLIEQVKKYPSLTYQAVNLKGETFSNVNGCVVNAVTWGCFPGKEILQPTVVDPASFLIWKDEAFQLWLDDWGVLYPEDSQSRRIIDEINRTYFLVNMVENDFVQGDIFQIFRSLNGKASTGLSDSIKKPDGPKSGEVGEQSL